MGTEKHKLRIEDWGGQHVYAELHNIASKDPNNRQVTLFTALGTEINLGTSGIIWDKIGGFVPLDGSIWIQDQGSLNGYLIYLAHELGHNPTVGDWQDCAIEQNLMFGGPYDHSDPIPKELNYRELPHYYQIDPDQSQWNQVPGR